VTCDAAHRCISHASYSAHTAPDWLVLAIVPALIVGVVGLFWLGAILSTTERS
jgi:fatty-acid desaturase